MATRTFFRVGAWYQSTEKALSDDIEATAIVSNDDPLDPVIVGGGVQTITAGTNITLGGTATAPIINASGGGSQTLDEVLAEGSPLTEDRTVDLDGNKLEFMQGGDQMVTINSSGDNGQFISLAAKGGTLGGAAQMQVYSNDVDGYTFIFVADDGTGGHEVSIIGNAANETIIYTADTHTFDGEIINPDLVEADFVDDVSAAAGGIAVGGLYHNAGAVRVRIA